MEYTKLKDEILFKQLKNKTKGYIGGAQWGALDNTEII